jgi:Fe-S cluster assembly iron-binding protein IscA
VLVDRKSAPYLESATIRFQDGKENGKRGFVFDNPKAVKMSD